MNGEEWQGWNSTVQYSTGVTRLKQWTRSRYRHTTCAPTELCRIEIVRQLNQFCKLIKSIHLCLIRRCTVCTTLCYIVAIYLADSVDTDITRAEPHYCHLTSGGREAGTLGDCYFFYLISADISGKYQKVDSKGMRSYNPKFGSKCSFKDLILS